VLSGASKTVAANALLRNPQVTPQDGQAPRSGVTTTYGK
jgi:hypothetical protein